MSPVGNADTSVMFWTRYEGAGPVSLRVLEMEGSRIAATRFNGRVTPSPAGFVRTVVTGLRPNRQHLYAFLTGPTDRPTGRSLVGRVQTAIPADSMLPITFGGTSCSNQSHRPFPVLQHAGSRTDLDFFIHAGDHTYADHGDNAVTIEQYRARHAENWASAGMRALHRSTGMYLTWDDHEVFNNWNPETISGARREILNHIANNRLRGVVWLSGDVHFGGVCTVEAAGAWGDIWEVIMGPAGANRDSRPSVCASQWPVLVHDVHNYTVLRADPTTRTLTVEFINVAGNRIANGRWSRRF